MKWTTTKVWAFLIPGMAFVITMTALALGRGVGESIAMFSSVILFTGGVYYSKHRNQEK